MDLILDKSYTLSVALDGGALVVTYPYDKPVQSGNTTIHTVHVYCLTVNLIFFKICNESSLSGWII